ncbi:MAG: hypothetical protein QM737_21720 [Ferruginibacter sp.]
MNRFRILKLTILYMLMIFLPACEGYEIAKGVVRDKSTNLPLDSVLCVSNGSGAMYTDSTGTFDVHGPFGGCMFGCKDIIVEFSKAGYQAQKITDGGKGIVILMER